MSWSTPRTWVSGAVLTAAQLNSNVRDNFNYLRSNATAKVATDQTTASTTDADLTTVGPAVTVTTDVQALVLVGAQVYNDTAQFLCFVTYAVSGATTIAAGNPIQFWSPVANAPGSPSGAFLQTGLTPGSNTFTLKYRVDGHTGHFYSRTLTVIPC